MTNNLSSDQFPSASSLFFQPTQSSTLPASQSNFSSTPTGSQGGTDQISTQKLTQGLLIGAELEALSMLSSSADAGGNGQSTGLGGGGSTISPALELAYILGQQNANNLANTSSTNQLLGADNGNNYGNGSGSGNGSQDIANQILMALLQADAALNSDGVDNTGNAGGYPALGNTGTGSTGTGNTGLGNSLSNFNKDLHALEQDLNKVIGDLGSDVGTQSDENGAQGGTSSTLGGPQPLPTGNAGSGIGPGIGPAVGDTNQINDKNSFDISSWGDPHITVTADGGPTYKEDKMSATSDLATFDTKGGDTTIGTTETTPDSKGITYNHTVSIDQHPAMQNEQDPQNLWNVTATDNGGTMSAVVTQGNKSTTLTNGQSLTESDGTVISDNNGKVTVNEQTQNGSVTETINDNGQGLDVDAKGTGQETVLGAAADLYNAKSNPQN